MEVRCQWSHLANQVRSSNQFCKVQIPLAVLHDTLACSSPFCEQRNKKGKQIKKKQVFEPVPEPLSSTSVQYLPGLVTNQCTVHQMPHNLMPSDNMTVSCHHHKIQGHYGSRIHLRHSYIITIYVALHVHAQLIFSNTNIQIQVCQNDPFGRALLSHPVARS